MNWSHYSPYLLLVIYVLPLVLVVRFLLKVRRKNEVVRPPISNDFSAQLILEDLKYIIRAECERVYTLRYSYELAKYAGSMEHSRLNFSTEIMNKSKLDELVAEVTMKIVDYLADSYRDRLASVIYETKIEDYILEEVHLYLFAKTLNVNHKTTKTYK